MSSDSQSFDPYRSPAQPEVPYAGQSGIPFGGQPGVSYGGQPGVPCLGPPPTVRPGLLTTLCVLCIVLGALGLGALEIDQVDQLRGWGSAAVEPVVEAAAGEKGANQPQGVVLGAGALARDGATGVNSDQHERQTRGRVKALTITPSPTRMSRTGTNSGSTRAAMVAPRTPKVNR